MLYFIPALLFVIALSADSFFTSFAYGSNKIKISFCSAMIINIVCSLLLAIAIIFGVVMHHYINEKILVLLSSGILFCLGIYKLIDSFTHKGNDNNQLNSLLSNKETILLATTLSLDGMVAGVGLGLNSNYYIQVIILSLLSDLFAVLLGNYLGNCLAKSLKTNLSWLSGIILIVLAFLKI